MLALKRQLLVLTLELQKTHHNHAKYFELVPSEGNVDKVTLSIQNSYFNFEAYVLLLVGYDMDLGVVWLQTLGYILLNFGELTMQFSVAG